MGIFRNLHDLQNQARELQRNAPPVGERLASAQARMASAQAQMANMNHMMEAQTRVAALAASGAAARNPVTIVGMRQVGSVNFDLLVEFEVTVTPEGMPPYPAITQQLVSQFQVGQLQPGRTLMAAIDPSDPAAIWLDFATLR
jgi:hypothetical protein